MLSKTKPAVFALNKKELLSCFAHEWLAIAAFAIKKKNSFSVALSGGKTPKIFYEQLAKTIPAKIWQKTHLFMVDERFVPSDHAESNFRMIHSVLISRIKISRENVHPMVSGSKSIEECAEEYSKEIPKLDLVILGIGEDGHTASLFPDDPQIYKTKSKVFSVSLPRLKTRRITLGFSVINSAKNVFFIAAGRNKAKSVADVLGGPVLPAGRVNPERGDSYFFLDKDAAGRIPLKTKKELIFKKA